MSAHAAVGTKSLLADQAAWGFSFSAESDLATEVLGAMGGEEKSKVSFCDKDLTGLERLPSGGRSG